MGVFNPQQVLFSPVSNYYQGKAIRQQQAAGEQEAELRGLQIDSAKQALADGPAQMRAARDKAAKEGEKLDLQVENLRGEGRTADMKFAADLFGPSIVKYGEMAGPDFANADEALAMINSDMPGLISQLPKEKQEEYYQIAQANGIEGFQHDEVMRLGRLIKGFTDSMDVDAEKLQQADFIDAEGNPQQGAFDPGSGEYSSSGQTPIAPQAGQDDISGGRPGDKPTDRMTMEVLGGAENLISSVDRITKQITDMPQSALGLPGAAASLIDNAVSASVGFAELLGGLAQVNGEDVSERALLDTRLYQDAFSGPAADNAALQANSIGLAYALARSANPDGRISDADVRHQLKRVKLDKSSKTQIQAAIREVRRSVLTNVSNHLRVYGYTDTKEGKTAYDKYIKELNDEQPKDDVGGNVTVVSSDADYDALPSGAEFTDEDGVKYRKP